MPSPRPPIVVILGHVDHGKTTLLDYLRKSNVAAREAGGITQHIRSFQIPLSTSPLALCTFIDTPGHSAFTSMRARGSLVADLAILVVACDDGVMPQTAESAKIIKEAGIPFLVALTKSDLKSADPDRVKTQLAEIEVLVEDFGGHVPAIPVSAKTGQGMPELLELLELLSSLNPPQADPEGVLQAVVLEASLDSKKGPLATLIIKNGTLRVGDPLFTDSPIGKVRAILDSSGLSLKEAAPSTPVEVLGLNSVPAVGSVISTAPQNISPQTAKPQSHKATETPFLSIILRCDVAGSLEAIVSSLPASVHVLSAGTGDFTETDVDSAKIGSAVLVGFNIKASQSVSKLAEVNHVPVYTFKTIYELLDKIALLSAGPPPEKILGKATVLAQFKINADPIAGCQSLEGVISRGNQIRLERAGLPVGSAKIKSLRLGKTAADSIKAGAQFGAVFSPSLDFQVGDHIIAVES